MISNFDQLIESFLRYYENHEHSGNEDYYQELKTSEYLQSLKRQEFIEYIFQFARVGGRVQSGGARTAGIIWMDCRKPNKTVSSKRWESPATTGMPWLKQ